MNRMDEIKEFLERTTTGIRCSCCKRPYDFQDTSWRWNGVAWEHKCTGNHPQAGYFQAERQREMERKEDKA